MQGRQHAVGVGGRPQQGDAEGIRRRVGRPGKRYPLELLKPLRQQGTRVRCRQAAEVVPEGRAQGVERRDFTACERGDQTVAEGGAELQAGLAKQGSRAIDMEPGRDHGIAHRRSRGAQVHEPPPVDRRIGIVAAPVGRFHEARDQVRIGELVAEELLHQGETAGHHGRRGGCAR